MLKKSLISIAVSLSLFGSIPVSAAEGAAGLEEVRNTIVNLLEALVQRGVMTREQAEGMVKAAQDKAAADATVRAAEADAEKDAVRVTYVPEIVQQQISERVRKDIRSEVVEDVKTQAREERWGVPGALPGWVSGVQLYGDVRTRAEGVLYADENAVNTYLDFNAVNDAGGIEQAGTKALLNTSEDRLRPVGRVRLGLSAKVGDSLGLDVRLASGNSRTPNSTNQTMGTYGGRWTVNVDKAAILWHPVNDMCDRELDVRFGRFSNPFFTTGELVWDNDLGFDGLSATYAMDLFGRDTTRVERSLFLTVGAFPLQEVELSTSDKWLLGGQLGLELPFGDASSIRLAAAYYDYRNITGIRNEFTFTLNDFTAPGFLAKGNSLFDIRNDSNPATHLFALAGDYRLANASMLLDLAAFGANHLVIGGEYVKNIGWDQEKVFATTGQRVEERTEGYEAGITFGRPMLSAAWQWRAFMRYRYLERDAVLDAFTDSDFHLGGTDTQGYEFGFDLGLSRGAWMRLRYLSANEINGPPLGIDVWQLDLNAQF